MRKEFKVMLLVLAEFDCLDYIHSKGVYPDAFFTDFETFQHHLIVKNNVDIVILLAGTCQFSKRVIQDYVTTLKERISSDTDTGVRSVCVLSDTELKKTDDYYLYHSRPDLFYHVQNGKKSKKLEDVWEKYRSEEKECAKYLVRQNLDELSKAIKARRDKDDELLEIIQVPHLNSR